MAKAVEQVIPVENNTMQKEKCWIGRMEDRRRMKDRDFEEYRRVHKEIVHRCKREKKLNGTRKNVGR